MLSSLKKSYFYDPDPILTFLLKFLNVTEKVADLKLIPTMIPEPNEQCQDFSLQNPLIFKEAYKCSYYFIIKVESSFSPISEAFYLSNDADRYQFVKLIQPFYSSFKYSNYRILRVIAAIFAKVFGLYPLDHDICAGIRYFNTSKFSVNDPNENVRYQALKDEAVKPEMLVADDNEEIRTTALSMCKNVYYLENLDKLIIGNFQSSRIAILSSYTQKNCIYSIAYLIKDQPFEFFRIIASDVVIAMAVRQKMNLLEKCNYSSFSEFALYCCVYSYLKLGVAVSKELFIGYQELLRTTPLRKIYESIEKQQGVSKIAILTDIAYHYYAFTEDERCTKAYTFVYYVYMDEFCNTAALKDYYSHYSTAQHENTDQMLDYLYPSIIAYLLRLLPENFPSTDAIKRHFNTKNLELLDKLSIQYIAQYEKLLLLLMLRLKEADLRDPEQTDYFCKSLNQISYLLMDGLYKLCLQGYSAEIDMYEKDSMLEKFEKSINTVYQHIEVIDASISAFSNLTINCLFDLFVILYCAKYFAFYLEDYKVDNNFPMYLYEIQKHIYLLLPFYQYILSCCIDSPLLKAQLNAQFKKYAKASILLDNCIQTLIYGQYFSYCYEFNLRLLYQEFYPDSDLLKIFLNNLFDWLTKQKQVKIMNSVIDFCKSNNIELEVIYSINQPQE